MAFIWTGSSGGILAPPSRAVKNVKYAVFHKEPDVMTCRLAMCAALVAAASAACSAPSAKSLADEALTAMGGAAKVKAIKTITMKDGSGTREQLLEPRHVGEIEPPAKLSKVTERVDLAGGRSSLHYVIDNAGFMQDRHEVMTKRGGTLVGLDFVGTRP